MGLVAFVDDGASYGGAIEISGVCLRGDRFGPIGGLGVLRPVSFEHEDGNGYAEQGEDADEGDRGGYLDAFGAHERDEDTDACGDGERAEGNEHGPSECLEAAVSVCVHTVLGS